MKLNLQEASDRFVIDIQDSGFDGKQDLDYLKQKRRENKIKVNDSWVFDDSLDKASIREHR